MMVGEKKQNSFLSCGQEAANNLSPPLPCHKSVTGKTDHRPVVLGSVTRGP